MNNAGAEMHMWKHQKTQCLKELKAWSILTIKDTAGSGKTLGNMFLSRGGVCSDKTTAQTIYQQKTLHYITTLQHIACDIHPFVIPKGWPKISKKKQWMPLKKILDPKDHTTETVDP